MKVYSCLDSEANLSQWGIEIPLLYSRPKQIKNFLEEKNGKNIVHELSWNSLSRVDLERVHTKLYLESLFDKSLVDKTMMNIYELVKPSGEFHRYDRSKQKRPFFELF